MGTVSRPTAARQQFQVVTHWSPGASVLDGDALLGGIRRCFAWMIGALIAVHFLGLAFPNVAGFESYQVQRLTSLNYENNPATWFSSLQLACCATAAGLIWFVERDSGNRLHRSWGELALLLATLSLDEAASLHETLAIPARWILKSESYQAPWFVLGIFVAAAIAVHFSKFVRSLDGEVRRGLLQAAAIFFGGALVMEFISTGLAKTGPVGAALYPVLSAFEEAMEMFGSWTLLGVLGGRLNRFRITAGLR